MPLIINLPNRFFIDLVQNSRHLYLILKFINANTINVDNFSTAD